MKVSNKDLIERLHNYQKAILMGERVDMRMLHDLEREVVRRGMNLEKEKKKRLRIR